MAGTLLTFTINCQGRWRVASAACRHPPIWALPAGRYVLFCNLLETAADGSRQNHYANGMRAGFEVRG